MLELHVWGPAFSLPSIDPRCLAAIAYLQRAVPSGQWQLVASSDPTLSPTNELPALRNGEIWIGGFRNIFHYIAQHSAGDWTLDAGLTEQEEADCIAFSSFIESHGQPLIDLSLYVSASNYTTTTRPLFNTIQPFPLPYLTPPALRSAAKLRTSHLNLPSLDLDTDIDKPPPERSIIPESLRRPKNTVSSLLSASPEMNARIRLDALATDFFEPLATLKSQKQHYVSDKQFTSFDCLALGYLSLMLVPEFPQPWLADAMKKFPRLCSWTVDMGQTIYGEPVTVENAFVTDPGDSTRGTINPSKGARTLPWMAANTGGVIDIGATFVTGLADSVPIFGQLRRNMKLRQHGSTSSSDEALSLSWQKFPIVAGLVASLSLVAGLVIQQRAYPFGPVEGQDMPEGDGGLGGYGEAGAALSVLASQMDNQAQEQRIMARNLSHGD